MAGHYQTRCPHCGAQFKISDEHLGQARGAVRCGSCLQIFQATEHLLSSPGKAADDTLGNTPDNTPDDAPSDAARDDRLSMGESQFSDSFLSLDGDTHGDDDFSDLDQGGSEGGDEAWAEALLQELEDDEPAPAPASTSPRPRDTAAPVRREPPPEPEPEDQFDFLNASARSPRAVSNERLDYQRPGTDRAGLFKWVTLSALALLVLAGQYAYFHFDDLARDPRWRPLYAQACEVIGCQLPLQSDPDRLRGANLVVRSHPDTRNALLVDALLFNEGDWPQPFPVLELTFSDMGGQTVASRRFAPAEYLRGELDGASAMPAHTPVHISLEIIDPGDNAVNYDLRLLATETAGQQLSRRP